MGLGLLLAMTRCADLMLEELLFPEELGEELLQQRQGHADQPKVLGELDDHGSDDDYREVVELQELHVKPQVIQDGYEEELRRRMEGLGFTV